MMVINKAGSLYHRFVKTTPKPKATKKSNGELVGPPPPEELPPVLAGCIGDDDEDMTAGVGMEVMRFCYSNS